MGRLRPCGLACARIGAALQEHEDHQLRDIHSTITEDNMRPDELEGTASKHSEVR